MGDAYHKIIGDIPLEKVMNLRLPFRDLPYARLKEADYGKLHDALQDLVNGCGLSGIEGGNESELEEESSDADKGEQNFD